jgi:hypothetical protein
MTSGTKAAGSLLPADEAADLTPDWMQAALHVAGAFT